MPYDKQLRERQRRGDQVQEAKATANPGQGGPKEQVTQVLVFAGLEPVRSGWKCCTVAAVLLVQGVPVGRLR
jgi:hypothetical protein